MKKYIFILFLSISTGFSLVSQTFNLSYDLKKGDQFVTDFLSEISIKQTVMGIEQNVGMNMESRFLQKVKEIDQNSDYELSVEYQKMFMQISSTFFSLEMDTEKKNQDDVLSNIIKRALHRPMKFIISPKGEIKEISGTENLINDLFEDTEIEEDQKEQIRQLLISNMGEESMKQNFSLFHCLYPAKPVRLSETWDISYRTTQADMTLEFSGKGKLVEVTPRTFLVRVEGMLTTINLSLQEGGDQLFLLRGLQVSEIVIDRKSGWPIQSTANQDVSGLLYIQTNGDEEDRMEIPMQMKMRMNTKSTRQK